jgi:hypothetical protein
VYYDGASGTANTTGYGYTSECVDEALTDLVPYVSKDVSSVTYDEEETVTVGKNSDNLFRWYLNDTTLQVEWNDPVSFVAFQ